MSGVVLGAIADDFTGATDLANTLTKEGMRVVQAIGTPASDADFGDVDAVVVAQKTRTAPVAEAVEQSLQALGWLRAQGARQILQKYCSTFDSTVEGNIGPIADALRAALGAPIAIVCPAFPGAGRTIYQGQLFVGRQLLAESSMKDHPLTPMRDSDLTRLMGAQCAGRVGLAPWAAVRQGVDALRAALETLAAEGCAYAVVDAIEDADLRVIGGAIAEHSFATGGSGAALGLPDAFRRAGLLSAAPSRPVTPPKTGAAAVLAGSCSTATRGQIAAAKAAGWPMMKIEVDALAAGEDVVGAALAFVDSLGAAAPPPVIYASADPAEVAAAQARHGRERAGALVEAAMGAVAQGLVARGVRRLVVAGGETSGAVVSSLGVTALRIGPEIDPGVPWCETIGGSAPLALALKSGNFGRETFFPAAFAALEAA